jgi:hypothetical protein
LKSPFLVFEHLFPFFFPSFFIYTAHQLLPVNSHTF